MHVDVGLSKMSMSYLKQLLCLFCSNVFDPSFAKCVFFPEAHNWSSQSECLLNLLLMCMLSNFHTHQHLFFISWKLFDSRGHTQLLVILCMYTQQWQCYHTTCSTIAFQVFSLCLNLLSYIQCEEHLVGVRICLQFLHQHVLGHFLYHVANLKFWAVFLPYLHYT